METEKINATDFAPDFKTHDQNKTFRSQSCRLGNFILIMGLNPVACLDGDLKSGTALGNLILTMSLKDKSMIKKITLVWSCIFVVLLSASAVQADGAIIVDHHCTDITRIPQAAIENAKASLHIAYGHTSHGSQITSGMDGLVAFANGGGLGLSLPQDIFKWNNGGSSGALDLEEGDGYGSGWMDHDCGYYPDWVDETREYLDDPSHSDVNVIIWSWCGQVSNRSEQSMIDTYLAPMTQLEQEYPNVTFVYMTGHADGSGETGNLHLRNQQIRDYCTANNKVLFDFYDIECHDPDGNYYGDKRVNDNCDYDSDGNGSRDANWATQWQNTHTQDVEWYNCSSAHSQPLNANQKAYAAWWLWARLGGWEGPSETSVPAVNLYGLIAAMTGLSAMAFFAIRKKNLKAHGHN